MLAAFFAAKAAAFVVCASATAAALVQVTLDGPSRPAPQFGFGGEYIFQTVGDDGLNAALRASGSALTRFPGGTPADYWDWSSGWMSLPTGSGCGGCDEVPWRPTSPQALREYLAATSQQPIFVVNQLTSNLSWQLAGLHAHESAGSAVALVEMGNEMYDQTRPDVLAEYPDPVDYAIKMQVWTAAVKAAFPAARVAWIGLANTWDNRTRAWNDAVLPLAPAAVDAATIHLYPGLPAANLSDPSAYAPLLASLFPLLSDYRNYTDETVPARLRLWVTEWGTWGLPAVTTTWLQALWHAAFVALLPVALPRVDVVTPYCAVCGDPNMPSFTADGYGPIVPPNVTVNASAWRRTASGHGYALVFGVAAAPAAAGLQGLAFYPNPPLDPALASSRALVGLRAVDAAGAGLGAVFVNLGAAAADLDISAVPLVCGGGGDFRRAQQQQRASVYAAASVADAARQGIRVEELQHSEGPVAGGVLHLPAYAIGTVTCGP